MSVPVHSDDFAYELSLEWWHVTAFRPVVHHQTYHWIYIIASTVLLAGDVIYTSRAYAMMPVRLSVMKVHWRIIANLGFKF